MLRIGYGTDQHRYIAGSGILLGGVFVEADFAVSAHSDGDVLLHALTDALLGAVAAGDIGELFPDTATVNSNRSSADFVEAALDVIAEKGFGIINIDATIQAQKPKLSAYKNLIAERIANLIGVERSCVGIKAKTAEGMDSIGECRGIRADVVVLLQKKGGVYG